MTISNPWIDKLDVSIRISYAFRMRASFPRALFSGDDFGRVTRSSRGWRKSEGRGLSIKGLETGERGGQRAHVRAVHPLSPADYCPLGILFAPTRDSHVTAQIGQSRSAMRERSKAPKPCAPLTAIAEASWVTGATIKSSERAKPMNNVSTNLQSPFCPAVPNQVPPGRVLQTYSKWRFITQNRHFVASV